LSGIELASSPLARSCAAPYHHDPHEAISYFVKIETPRGDCSIWGVDLERALKESLTDIPKSIGSRPLQ
jgi:hypothetical protein